MADGSTIALALSAVFDLCVPTASGGRLEQKFPSALVVPLTNEEKVEYADAIQGDNAFRIRSDAGFILLTMTNSFCRVITADGNTDVAFKEFRQKLVAAGGKEDGSETLPEGHLQISGMIPLKDDYAVVVVFSAKASSNTGFFSSAFMVHKDGHG